jgi:hypothetical protein
MNIHSTPAGGPPPDHSVPPSQSARRQSSRSGSISSSSVVTVQRSASLSLRDANPDPSTAKPHTRATPPPSATRRRSSAANGAADGIGAFRDGATTGNVNRWSQSTAGSSSREHERKAPGHHHHPSFSRKLSITAAHSLVNGAAAHPSSPTRLSSSPARNHNQHTSHRSPTQSPRRARPRSPVYDPPSSVTAAPRVPSLPPILLPATVYDPNTPTSTSTNNSPSASSLFTPSLLTGNQPRDYFNSKPTVLPPGQRPPSRNRVDKVLGKSPLGSPAIIQEVDARHDSASGPGRPTTSRRPSIAGTRDTAQKLPQSAGHRPAASRDHSRSHSKDHQRSSSRDLARSSSKDNLRRESNASARLDDGYQHTPPRTRERREKDKKTMLSRALQKANTAVLLDNAQNFEGAMEAYEDACKLLQQVMIRSSQEEDRRKLDSIVGSARHTTTIGCSLSRMMY